MYLPCITEWFFERRTNGVYDVTINDLMTICSAAEVGNAFYVLSEGEYDPYEDI